MDLYLKTRCLNCTCSEVVILKVFQHSTKFVIIIVLYATREVINLSCPIILVALLKANFLHFQNIHGSAGLCNKIHIYLRSYFVIMPTFARNKYYILLCSTKSTSCDNTSSQYYINNYLPEMDRSYTTQS